MKPPATLLSALNKHQTSLTKELEHLSQHKEAFSLFSRIVQASSEEAKKFLDAMSETDLSRICEALKIKTTSKSKGKIIPKPIKKMAGDIIKKRNKIKPNTL
ncbi:MAG: hypothetical protein PHV34_07660 [Verrucomicrobiae bacterium]|nr:hypothetical protein [Verrucomicrobiae bacterium]